jgi:hypothetical protein
MDWYDGAKLEVQPEADAWTQMQEMIGGAS